MPFPKLYRRPPEPLIGFEAEFLFDIPPTNDWDEIRWNDLYRIAVEFFAETGIRCVAKRGPQQWFKGRKPTMDWSVLAENSISWMDYVTGGAAEIVSPPLPWSAFTVCLNQVLRFIAQAWAPEEGDGFTLQTEVVTGFHINVSVPEIDRLDPIRLILHLDEERLLRRFDRHEISGFHQQRDELLAGAAGAPTLPNDLVEFGVFLRQFVKYGKPWAINLSRLQEGYHYIEFRHCGGCQYESMVREIRGAAAEFVSVTRDACAGERGLPAHLNRLRRFRRQVEVLKSFFRSVTVGPPQPTGDRNVFIDGQCIGDVRSDIYSTPEEKLLRFHGTHAWQTSHFSEQELRARVLLFQDAKRPLAKRRYAA